MRKSLSTMSLCLLSVLVWPALASAQAPQRMPFQAEVSKTDIPSCYDRATGKLLGSKLVRSPVLVSPDGCLRAYTENQAVAFRQPGKGRVPWQECVNTARLFLAGPKSGRFDVVFVKEPQPDALVKGLMLVDWSADGRYLLFQEFDDTYGSDAGGWGARLFDAYYDVFWPQDFAYNAMTAHFGKTCYAPIAAQGFSKDGKIILAIGPDYDEEGYMDADSCVKKAGVWSLDPWKGDLVRMADGYKVHHYGRWVDVALKHETTRKHP